GAAPGAEGPGPGAGPNDGDGGGSDDVIDADFTEAK
ncbi:hypothetical protein B9R42_13050, partial [Arthrospira platensis PCC 7345]